MRRLNKKWTGWGIVAMLLSLLGITQPQTADVTLSWTNPTERTDGTALLATELATFTLTCSGGKSETGLATETSHTFNYSRVTESGDHSCSVFVTDTGGRVTSAVTTNFVVETFLFAPKAPTDFTATVVNN